MASVSVACTSSVMSEPRCVRLSGMPTAWVGNPEVAITELCALFSSHPGYMKSDEMPIGKLALFHVNGLFNNTLSVQVSGYEFIGIFGQ